MATARSNRHSIPHDQFYTRRETAASCIAHLHAVWPTFNPDFCLEPAAGDGAFLGQLPLPRLGLDIAPADPEVAMADFLTWVPGETLGDIAVVGNPPFGRNAALAVRFFNHAAEFAGVIAMIMPASMSKSSMQNRLDARFHLVSEMPLPAEPFRVAGGQLHPVNTVFQVWQRSETARRKAISVRTHADFAFVTTVQEADFVLRRVGARAGAILPVPGPGPVPRGYAPASNLFIRARGIDPAHLEARFRRLDFDDVRRCAAANPSVSKGEIVTLYCAVLELDRITETKASARQPDRTTNVSAACPILPVGELHGRTLKHHLARMLPTPEAARPGEIVAIRCCGLVFETSWLTATTTFLVETHAGITERCLHELAPDQIKEAAMCVGFLEDDWQIVEEFPEDCQCPDDAGPRRYEILHCRDALLLLWLEEHRSLNDPPALLPDAEIPAALLIAEDDLVGPDALAPARLDGIVSLGNGLRACNLLIRPRHRAGRPLSCLKMEGAAAFFVPSRQRRPQGSLLPPPALAFPTLRESVR